MDTAMVIDLCRQALWTIALVSAPLLLVSLAIGLVIGILQAATSINEMTLSFIPKLIGLALTLLMFGSWQIVTLVDFTRSIFQRIPSLFS
jgi:flagellar biosynthesis protein FliQ